MPTFAINRETFGARILVGVSLLLSACVGPLVPVAILEPETKARLQSQVEIFQIADTPAGNYSRLGPIVATSCKNQLTDANPSLDDAFAQLRYYSLQRNGNAVLDVVCESAGTRLETNCWSSITCRGTAARIEPKPQLTSESKVADRFHPSQISVPLASEGGTFSVPVKINGSLTLHFTIDSGASSVTLPADVVLTLIRTGTINNSDFIDKTVYQLADGSTMPSSNFVLRTLNVGDVTVENVRAAVAPVQGSLLLGQSFLSRFKSWSIDNSRQELVLELLAADLPGTENSGILTKRSLNTETDAYIGTSNKSDEKSKVKEFIEKRRNQ